MVERIQAIGHPSAGRITIRGFLILLLLVAGVYYGIGAISVYYRYWRMESEMRAQARLAPGLDDAVIRRRLVLTADRLDLPQTARRFMIQRRTRPPEIVITTSWQETLELPFTNYVLTVRPEARAPL